MQIASVIIQHRPGFTEKIIRKKRKEKREKNNKSQMHVFVRDFFLFIIKFKMCPLQFLCCCFLIDLFVQVLLSATTTKKIYVYTECKIEMKKETKTKNTDIKDQHFYSITFVVK